jgi:hypothetical protein
VIELPMPYADRIGRSKLSVLSDGVRFLRAIISGVLCYRPEKIFLLGLVVCMAMAALLAAYPTEFYVKNGLLEEWMIYRFMACFLLGSFGLLLLLATALTNQMAYLGARRVEADRFWSSLCAAVLGRPAVLAVLTASLLALATVVLWPGIVELVTTGHVNLHWSRLLTGAFALFSVGHILVFGVLFKVVSIWKSQRLGREAPAAAEAADIPLAATPRPSVSPR